MAGQAFLIRNLFAQGMAFGAITHTFEMRMHFSQFTWRNLGISPGASAQNQQEYANQMSNL